MFPAPLVAELLRLVFQTQSRSVTASELLLHRDTGNARR